MPRYERDISAAFENGAYPDAWIHQKLAELEATLRRAERLKGELLEAMRPLLRDPPARRGKPSTARVERVRARDGRECQICGSTEGLETDHILPTALGGSDQEWNLWTLCEPCNREKGNRLIPAAIRKLRELIPEHEVA